MTSVVWTNAEKSIARRVFDAALQRELADIMAEFKRRTESAKDPDDLWAIERFLSKARREIDTKYDFRYSQLDVVFARLLYEGRIKESDLDGLSEDKIARICGLATFCG